MRQTSPVVQNRLRDQEVWAQCLVPGNYDEGSLQEGQVFRVGHSAADGTKLLHHPYPAVRMEWFRSYGYAERVEPGGSTYQDANLGVVEERIQEARKRRVSREESKDADRPLPATDGGLRP